MTILFYDDTVQQQAADFLEDLADVQAGIERCKGCHQHLFACDCPDLVAAGLSPVAEG